MMRAVTRYQLILPKDRIMVAISGGKDSYALLDLLWRSQQRAPFKFEIIAVHIDQGQPGYQGEELAAWLARFGAPYEILHKDTYSVVQRVSKPGETLCAPCSRMRRGVLYSAAERLGCNKIALGHHRDDALETLLLNLFYTGRLQAMPPRYLTNDERFQVIRPLIECAEAEIAEYAALMDFPILPCTLCGSQPGLKRQAMKQLLNQLEAQNPGLRDVMLAALKNVRGSHLMDLALMGPPPKESKEPKQPDSESELIQIDA